MKVNIHGRYISNEEKLIEVKSKYVKSIGKIAEVLEESV